MSDESRDRPDGIDDPVGSAGVPRIGPVGDAPIEDARTDGSRTDVSAPWERPRRWERSSPSAGRVDALLAKLGNLTADGSTAATDTRRSRRKNNDGEAVPASELIAALGPAGAEPAPASSGPEHAEGSAQAGGSEYADGVGGPAGGAAAGDTRGDPDREHSEQEDPDPSGPRALPWPPTTAAADESAPHPAQPPAAAAAPDEGHTDDVHTDFIPKATVNAAALAEAGSIRAALETQQHGSLREPPGADVVATGARNAAAPGGAALLHGADRPRRRHRWWLYAGRTVAALVALCTLLGVGVEWKIKDRADVAIAQNSVVPEALNTTDPSISTARTTAVVTTNSKGVKTTEPAPPPAVYKPENILLLGSDTRSGGNAAIGGTDSSTDGTQNSDTLMVAHVSGDRQHVTILSIPRDTLIPAPHCKSWNSTTGKLSTEDYQVDPGQIFHINSAYAVGGPTCTVTAVQSLTGLGITRMIGIDFKGFQAMVDALGGITVNVCKPIHDAVLGTVVADGGTQVIHGAQAISLVRARDVIGDTQSDLARIHRQQVVLSAILRQVTQAGTLLNPGKLDGFLQAFAKNTFTKNVTLTDLVTLADSLGTLDPGRVTFYTLPTVPSTRIDGALEVDDTKAPTVFDDLVNDLPLPGEVTTTAKPKPTAAATTTPAPSAPSLKLTVAPSKVAVELYNVSGRDNVAGMAQEELNAAGFSIDDTQLFKQDRTQNGTVVQFDLTNRAAALTVAAAVPGSTLQVIPGLGKTVHLQLGSSFAGVIRTVAVGQTAPGSLSTAISTGKSVAPSRTTAATSSTALSSVNAGAGTCA